jgi:lysophospholipase L1-like esterase
MRRALLTLLLVIAGAVGSTGAPVGATVVEDPAGPVGYFSLASPAPAQSVTLSGTTASSLTLAGVAGVPAVGQLTAVAMNVTVAAPASSSALKVWANGTTEPTAYAAQFTSGATQSTLVTSAVGSDGKIALKSAGSGSTPVSVVAVGFYAVQQSCTGTCLYHNRFAPARGTTVYDGLARPGSAGEVLTEASPTEQIPIHGVAGVPSTATQAVVRVAALPDAPIATGRRVDIRPGGAGSTTLAGQVGFGGANGTSKMVTTAIASGRIDLLVPDTTGNDGANIRVVVDIVGYYVGSTYTPVAVGAHPAGVLDPFTVSHGTGVPLDVRAMDGLPHAYSSFRGAVALDVSVTGATKAGTVSLGGGVPHVTFAAGQDATNQAIVPVTTSTSTLTVTYTAASGGTGSDSVTVRVTPVGAFQLANYANPATNPGDLFAPVAPTQIYTSPFVWTSAGGTVTLPVLGVAGVPSTGVSRVALQVTSRNNTGTTDVRVAGGTRPFPGSPQLTTSGQRTEASVIADVGPDGNIKLLVGPVKTTLDVTVVGWFTPYAGNGAQADSLAFYGDSITVLASDDVMTALDDTHRLGALGASGFKAEGLGWWADSIGASRPDQVVVNLGTNDAWLGGPTAAQTRASVVDQLAAFTTASCRWVVTVNAQTTPTTSYAGRAAAIDAEYRALPAPGNRIGVIDWDAYLADYVATTGPISDLIDADGIHPTPAGLTALAGLYEDAATGTSSTFVTPCS